MRLQQKIWKDEHQTAKALPSEMEVKENIMPSSYVTLFVEYLKNHTIELSGKK